MNCTRCGRALGADDLFCPQCGTPVKRAGAEVPPTGLKLPSSAFAPGKKTMSPGAKTAYALVAVLLIVGMGIAFVRSLPGGSHPVIMSQPSASDGEHYEGLRLTMKPTPARVQGGFIVIALDELSQKKMVSFSYEGATRIVEIIAYITQEGKVVTAIAMCEPCNSKSFHSESNELVCDNCGTRWNLSSLEGISGACQKYPPDPIPSSVVGNEIRISEKLVQNWKMRI